MTDFVFEEELLLISLGASDNPLKRVNWWQWQKEIHGSALELSSGRRIPQSRQLRCKTRDSNSFEFISTGRISFGGLEVPVCTASSLYCCGAATLGIFLSAGWWW